LPGDKYPVAGSPPNFDEPQALAYGTQHGAGWRLDCLGDMRAKFPEMLDIYPQQVVRTGIQDVWQHAPVSLETCGTPSTWKRPGFDVTYKPGTSILISMWWLNAGVAPIYKEYWLAVELQSVEKTTVLRIPADVTGGSRATRLWTNPYSYSKICLLVPIVFVSPCSIQKPANPQYCWPSRGDSLTAGTTWDRSN
jgi:hypothetical protein